MAAFWSIDSNLAPNIKSPANGMSHNLLLEAASPGQVFSHNALLAEFVRAADAALKDSADASAIKATTANKVAKDLRISCLGESAEICDLSWSSQCFKFLATSGWPWPASDYSDCQDLLRSIFILLPIGSFKVSHIFKG